MICETNDSPNTSTAPTAPPAALSGLIARARNPYWMAPMSGITDVCYRQLIDEMDAGVVISELISAKGLIYSSERTRRMLTIHEKPGTIIGIQLFGEMAEDFITASRMVEEAGADFLDINLGCPVTKVTKKGCGSALMRDPGNLEKFLSEIKNGIGLPLTVKMRTGWNEQELTIHECVKAAYNAGCEWVAIHGRTRAQAYEGNADWDLIKNVKQNAKLPIIGNGDIRSAQRARERLEESGVDAVMIGRGALRNPWIFKQCTGKLGEAIDPSPMNLLTYYLSLLETHYDLRRTLILLRKLAVWLAFGYPGSAAFRKSMFQLHSAEEILNCSSTFFDDVSKLDKSPFQESEAFMMGGHG